MDNPFTLNNGDFSDLTHAGSCKLDTDETAISLDVVGDELFAFTKNTIHRLDSSPETGFKPVKVWDNGN